MVLKSFIVGLVLWYAMSLNVCAQELLLVRAKDTVLISCINWGERSIGLTTNTDTICYAGKGNILLGYELERFDKVSITVKRPLRYRDTLVVYEKQHYPPYIKGAKVIAHNKRKRISYDSLVIIDEYEYKTYLYSEITTVLFPPKGCVAQEGCIMCMLFPPTYPFLISAYRARSIPKTYSMIDWEILYRKK